MMEKRKFLEILLFIGLVLLTLELFSQHQRIAKLEENQMHEDASEKKVNETLLEQEVKKESEEIQTDVYKEEEQYEQFVKLLFQYTENEYIETTGGITFYSDPTLEKEIGTSETLVFGSYYTKIVNINNKTVYGCILIDGSVCYCRGDEAVRLSLKM